VQQGNERDENSGHRGYAIGMRWPSLEALLLLMLFAACSSPEQRAENARLQALTMACQAELEAIYAAGSFPGATATLRLADGGLIRLAVGETEQGGRPLTVEDRMLVGSVGKVWVASLVHKLVELGAFDYDDRAADWFQKDAWYGRIPNAREVTIRQLLQHQSGFERYELKPEFWQELMEDPERVWTPRELLEFVFDDKPLFAPGEGWAYADTNYILLGMILERASGERFYDLAQKWLNNPFHLNNTIPSDRQRLPGVVQGTVVVGRQLGVGPKTLADGVFTYNVQFEWCGGGFASTATDLARLAEIFIHSDFLRPETHQAMLAGVPAPELGPDRQYGLGVILTQTPLGPLYGHDGFMPGYLTAMGYFPELDIAGAIQINTDDARSVGMSLHAVLVRLTEKVCAATAPTATGKELTTSRR
jgi:D-alanyl-D-alanine carboxypeptidase